MFALITENKETIQTKIYRPAPAHINVHRLRKTKYDGNVTGRRYCCWREASCLGNFHQQDRSTRMPTARCASQIREVFEMEEMRSGKRKPSDEALQEWHSGGS